MEPAIQQGYLVLADLSGYTRFMADSELDHAQGIHNNLLSLLRRHLTPTLQLAEVEGDALFLYVPGHRLTRGETLLELVESAYAAFRDKLQTMQRNATCPCEACLAIPSLDLKFVTHAGEYVLQNITGIPKPFGSSVNLAHRLLKNTVSESTGWPAYALFTEAALERMDVWPEGMYVENASYEHLGETKLGALDLRRRYEELSAGRTAYVGPEDAHFTVRRRFAVPPAILWEYLNDPHKRGQWEIGSDWGAQQRPKGRTGVGSHNHCSNSEFTEEVLDWRPLQYYTVSLTRGRFRILITGELLEAGAGTELQWSMAVQGSWPRALRAAACRIVAKRGMHAPERFDRLERLLASEEQLLSVPVA